MEFADYVEILLIFQTHSSIRLFHTTYWGIKVIHNTQKQNDFYEVWCNHIGSCGDYCFLGFHAMWSGRSAILKDLLPPSSGQERIPPKPDKVVQFPGWKLCPSKGRQWSQHARLSSLHHSPTQQYQYAELYTGTEHFCLPAWRISASPTHCLLLCRYCIVYNVSGRLNN